MGIRETLEYYGITSIYHFTDKANLKMIEKFDIQSLKNIHMFNIPVEHFGANETSHIIDKNRGLDEYVHLSFIKDHPMYHVAKKRGSIINPVWIEIDISVLYKQDTLFCNEVANAYGARTFTLDNVLKNIDFNTMLFEKDFGIRKEARKAEIMVFDSISTYLIKGFTDGK